MGRKHHKKSLRRKKHQTQQESQKQQQQSVQLSHADGSQAEQGCTPFVATTAACHMPDHPFMEALLLPPQPAASTQAVVHVLRSGGQRVGDLPQFPNVPRLREDSYMLMVSPVTDAMQCSCVWRAQGGEERFRRCRHGWSTCDSDMPLERGANVHAATCILMCCPSAGKSSTEISALIAKEPARLMQWARLRHCPESLLSDLIRAVWCDYTHLTLWQMFKLEGFLQALRTGQWRRLRKELAFIAPEWYKAHFPRFQAWLETLALPELRIFWRTLTVFVAYSMEHAKNCLMQGSGRLISAVCPCGNLQHPDVSYVGLNTDTAATLRAYYYSVAEPPRQAVPAFYEHQLQARKQEAAAFGHRGPAPLTGTDAKTLFSMEIEQERLDEAPSEFMKRMRDSLSAVKPGGISVSTRTWDPEDPAFEQHLRSMLHSLKPR